MSSKRKLFHEKPKTTVDHYSVTGAILDRAGNTGLGIIGTNARNRLPKDIEPFYLHKEKKMQLRNIPRLQDSLSPLLQ